MSLFGFDAFLTWKGAGSELRFWFGVVLLGPVLLGLAANLLLHHVAWPRMRRMR